MELKKNKQLYKTLREQFFNGNIKEETRQNKLFEPLGINYSTFRTLMYLMDCPDGAEPGKMADDLAIMRHSVTGIVDQLEKMECAERTPHPTDRRRLIVKILPKGKKLAAEAVKISMDYHQRITGEFTEEELSSYINIRNRMTDAKDRALSEILEERRNKIQKKTKQKKTLD